MSIDFFNSDNFMPHGHCFLWEPQILWLHVISDALVGLAYFSIPIAAFMLARKRKDFSLRYIFVLFGTFIVLCGTTHFLSIWVLWYPDYGPEGLIKAMTAIASVFTAIVTWRIMPTLLSMPSPQELQEMNKQLKETNKKVEQEVAARTAELQGANAKLLISENLLRQAARQSEQQFKFLVQGVRDYAIYMLDPDGIIVSWNAGAEHIKGYKAEEVIGKNYSMFFTMEGRQAGAPERSLRLAVGMGKHESEAFMLRKNGDMFRAHTIIDPIYDDSNQLIGFAKVTRDVTEQYAAAQKLEQTREQLYQAQKMETVGHLTGGIAHDFNNLLQTLGGSLALISKNDLSSNIKNLIAIAEKAAARGATLTRQLLAFSRQQTLNPQTSNINDVILSFAALLKQACTDNIKLRFDLADPIGQAQIDQGQLQSGLLNLIINARDAMPDGGTITISTTDITLKKKQTSIISEIPHGTYVLVSVADTGQGMSSDIIAKSIEPFFTTKEFGKGSGLGLSQVYGFVRQSNGHMEIESNVRQGTTIKLYFPRLAKEDAISTNIMSLQTPETNTDNHHPTGVAAKSNNVLVVEDDTLVLAVTIEAIQSLGYNVYPATGAEQALAVVNSNTPIDIIFSDVVMPNGMNGLDLAREVMKIRPSIHVLLVSGYSREFLAAKEGVKNIALMNKPYRLEELDAALRAALVEA